MLHCAKKLIKNTRALSILIMNFETVLVLQQQKRRQSKPVFNLFLKKTTKMKKKPQKIFGVT